MTSHTDVAIEPIEPREGEEMIRGTRVHVRDRMSWKLLVEFFRSRTAEGKHLAQACRLAPIPVLLDGDDLVGEFAPDALMRRRFRTGKGERAISGEVVLPDVTRESAEVHFLMNGVCVVSHEISDHRWLGGIGYVAYLDAPLLSRNASHSDVHQDDEFKRAMGAVRKAARNLLTRWLEHRLLGEDQSWRDDAGVFSSVERHYIEVAMRVLVRGKRARQGRPIDALLDVPGIVELAVRRPRWSSLRPVWEAYRARKACDVATRQYDVDLRDVPDGVVPIIGPAWIIKQVFHGKRRPADELLEAVEDGLKNRRKREAMRRLPELSAGEAMVKVALSHEKHGIVGELGVLRPGSNPAQLRDWSRVADLDESGNSSTYRVQVLFLREGVPLGVRQYSSHVGFGVAVIDSPNFAPTPAWDDLQGNAQSKSVPGFLGRVVSDLLRSMRTDFAQLPPPAGMRKLDYFGEEQSAAQLPDQLTAAWPTDTLARDARWHVDTILDRRRKFNRKRADWVWTWQLFHTMSGEPVSMAQMLGEQPLVSGEVVTLSSWRVVVAQPWGIGIPEGLHYVNLSAEQASIARSYLGRGLNDGTRKLEQERNRLLRRRECAQLRERNMAAARARRQEPTLDPRYYVASVPVMLENGIGEVGIPAFGGPPGHIRLLVDDLPLQDVELPGAIPVHAVVRSSAIEPNDTFDGARSEDAVEQLIERVRSHTEALVAQLTRTKEARVPRSRSHELIWRHLADRKSHKGADLPAMADALLDAPLLPTVDREPLTLRAAHADARAHDGAILVASRSLGRQLQERPISVLNGDKQRVVRRLLGIRIRDYTRSLQQEEEILARMEQPPRKPLLDQGTSAALVFEEDGVRGQVGIPRQTLTLAGKRQERWLDVLRDGVFLERKAWEVQGTSVIGIIDCADFRPTKKWDRVREDAVYKRAERIARAAAEQLFLRACQDLLTQPVLSLRDVSTLECLRALCARRFQGTPELRLGNAAPLDRALASAPLWPSADVDGHHRYSLSAITGQWRRTGVVWLVGDERGHLAENRIVVAGDAVVGAELRQIYGDRVRDGSKVLRRDNASHLRRMNAPELDPFIPSALVMESVQLEQNFEELALSVRGHVALHREYRGAEGGLRLTVGLDGQLLCHHQCEHPLRGMAYLDCRGLKANRGWDGMGDKRQMQALEELTRAALWRAAQLVVEGAGQLRRQVAADEHRRRVLLDAIRSLAGPKKRRPSAAEVGPFSLADATAAAIFYTVSGHAMSLDDVSAHVRNHGHILAIEDSLGRAEPTDGAVILHADSASLEVLQTVLGAALVRHDEVWREQLEGRRRRRETPRVEPHLGGDTVARAFAQRDSTTVLVGLLRPSAREKYGDSADVKSRLHLHVDGRKVTTKSQYWHPAIEAWIDDARMTPTDTFTDVVADQHFKNALALTREQIPELLASAAKNCLLEPSQALRLRLCHYALEHRERLRRGARQRPEGPEARFLQQPMWPCLTSNGHEVLSTEQLLAAREAEQLVVVDGDALGTAVAPELVAVRVAAVERRLLRRIFGKLRDYTDEMQVIEARRAFMRRTPVAAIELAGLDVVDPILWEHLVERTGWEGELALTDTGQPGIDAHIFYEHRALAVTRVPAPVSGVCAVQWDELQPTADFQDVEWGTRKKAFEAAIERLLWAALSAMAQDLVGESARLGASERVRAERLLLTVLASYRDDHSRRHRRTKKRGGPELQRVLEHWRNVPLLPDTAGRNWSVAALRASHKKREIATVEPETARLGPGLEERVVLCLDRELYQTAARLLRVTRYDQRYLEDVEARERMERAPTSYRLPRGALCVADVEHPSLSGQLALDRTLDDGVLGLFSHGRQVEVATWPRFVGLVGYIDGHLATNEAFTSVELETAQKREIALLYDARLRAAAGQVVAYKGRRSSARWHALRRYTCLYMKAHLADLGRTLAERRDHVLADHGSIPAPLRDALRCPIMELESGEYVDVATLLSSELPLVVRAPEVKRRRGKEPATCIVGGSHEFALLGALLGNNAVFAYEDWLASEERAAEKARKKREKQRKRAVSHLIKRLGVVLRAAAALRPDLGVSVARLTSLSSEESGSAPLVVVDTRSNIVLNREHAIWRRAADAVTGDGDAVIHLAAAMVSGLGLSSPLLGERDTVLLLSGLAEYAVNHHTGTAAGS